MDQGHPQWVLNEFPEQPISVVEMETGLIIFEDGISMDSNQHKMTTQALIDLADLLK